MVPESPLEAEFLAALREGNEAVARSIATGLADSGDPGVHSIIDELIPSALSEVGRLWESGALTVAEEHMATDICVSIVDDLAGNAVAPSRANGTVLVACAEGEWHFLAARALSLSIELAGFNARLLGPSITSSQLAAAIFDTGPNAIALTCSMPANLPGAVQMIETARETRTPILVGGRAFGDGPESAVRLGADGWGRSSRDLREFLGRLDATGQIPTELARVRHRDTVVIEAHLPEIVAQLSNSLGMEYALDGEFASGGVWLLRTLLAALLCDDREILDDHIRWHEGRARLGGALPAAVVIRALLAAIPKKAIDARTWLEEAALAADLELEL